MARGGDGPTCRAEPEHGRTYIIDGRAWCPHQSHDRTPGSAWDEPGAEPPVAVAVEGRRTRSRRGKESE